MRSPAHVYFFDLRSAEHAVTGVREQHIRQQCRLGQLYAAAAAAAASSPTWPPPAWDWPHDDNRGLVLGQAVWAHFAAASTVPDDGASRGSLVVLNSLPAMSVFELREIFQAYGTYTTTARFLPRIPLCFASCVSNQFILLVGSPRRVFAGDVKDVRESALRPSNKFVEFFDTRDADRALHELNGKELFGRRLVVEYTRPSLPGPRR